MEEEPEAPTQEPEAPKPAKKVRLTLEFDPSTGQIAVESDPPGLAPLFAQGLCLSVCSGLNNAAGEERMEMLRRITQDQQAATPGLILATESDLPPGMNLQRGGIVA